MTDSFSKRNGFHQVVGVPISVRNDAPHELRGILIDLAYECGFKPKTLRPLVCGVLQKRQDECNWSEYPNIDDEVRSLVDKCKWYRFYDVVEAIAVVMNETPYSYKPAKFEADLNDYFLENGIGWKLAGVTLEVRGSEVFEQSTRQTEGALLERGFTTAQSEFHEALHDLSRRPSPDTTGAIQHSMAALECVARVCCDDDRLTLGEILKRYRDLIPRPLDEAVAKMWGFASENARHGREGRIAAFEEAELLVGVIASVCTYLVKKNGP